MLTERNSTGLIATPRSYLGGHLCKAVGKSASVVLAFVLLGGCEMLPDVLQPAAVADPERQFELRRVDLAALDSWRATGRLGLKTPGDGFTATVAWTNSKAEWQLRLRGPLGQGTVQLAGTQDAVKLTTADGKTVEAPSADVLVQQALGWAIPVAGLRYWIVGDIDPDSPISALRLDQGGLLEYLEQGGWTIDYAAYLDADGRAMPSQIVMRNGDVEVRIVVLRWRFPDAPAS
jgi:outer membrane lipoprotein LolB